MSIILESHSPEQTQEYGSKFVNFLKPGDVISLNGDLGAGKTVFTKGLARGLGINENITSPTYAIISEYAGKFPLYHFDVYRIEAEELDDLGYEDYFYSNGVTVIEWGDKIKEKFPPSYLSINILYGSGQSERLLEFEGFGKFQTRLKKIREIMQ